MVQATGQVVPLKLDVDRKEVESISKKYNVEAIPAIFILDDTGKVLATINDREAGSFAASILKAVKAHSPRSGSKTSRAAKTHK